MKLRLVSTIFAVIALVAALVALLNRSSTVGVPATRMQPPSPRGSEGTPPPGREHWQVAHEPVRPPRNAAKLAEVYAKAVREHDPHPGLAAFRADSDDFFNANLDMAKEKAARQKITMEELRELTYFGLLMMRTMQWGDVEKVTGKKLTDDEKHQGDMLIFQASNDMEAATAAGVKDGLSFEARAKVAQEREQEFLKEYYAITEMTPELLDRMIMIDMPELAQNSP